MLEKTDEKEIEITKEYEVVSSREMQFYKIKKISHRHMIFTLMRYASTLIMLLLLCLPIIRVDGLLTEVKISVLDIITSKPDGETFKEWTASYFASDFLGVPFDEYKGFFDGLCRYPFAMINSFGAKDLIKSFIIEVSIFLLVIYAVVSVFGTITSIVNGCVGGRLKRANKENFDKAFRVEGDLYYYDKEAGEKALDSKRKIKSFVSNLIGYIVLVVLLAVFPFELYASLIKDEAVAINIIIPIAYVLMLISLFVGLIASHLHYNKYSGTLLGCNVLRRC